MSFKVSKSIADIPSYNSVLLNIQYKKDYGNCIEVKYKNKSINFSITYLDIFPVNTIGLNLCQRKYLDIENIENNNINVNISKYDLSKIIDITKLHITIKYDSNLKRQIKFKELVKLFESINNTIITKNNFIWMKWRGYNIKFEINNIELVDLYDNLVNNIGLFYFSDNLHEMLQFDTLENIEVIDIPKVKNNKLLKNINFNDLGIGGMNNELNELFRRTFNSRLLPSNVIKKYNIKHVKGILLYGPPGTGKTLIARSIGKVLNSSTEPVIINSSDIFNKYVGESENNIKKIFQPAYDDYKKNGENADLHVIIFDEFDAIAKVRGSDLTGVKDGIINLILTYIDGINQINNLLVIGITNRKDIIDPALIRPGRLEVHIYIGLPDEKGRNDIFNIHLNTFIQNKSLDENVNIKLLAEKTNNYSGAEIEGIVKNAQSYAFSNYVDITNISNNNNIKDIILENEHFDKAIKEIKPNFGSENNINISDLDENNGEYLLLTNELNKLFTSFKDNNSNYMSILIETPNNNNNIYSKYIHKFCLNSNINHYKTLIPENITGKSEYEISKNIIKLINDANETHESIIYLDNLQDLLGHIAIDNTYYRDVLRTLKVYINRPGIKNKLIIIASCKKSLVSFLELVDLYKERFTYVIY